MDRPHRIGELLATLDDLIAGTEGILEGNPDVREVVTVPARPGVGRQLSLLRRLWRRYDLAVIAETGDRPHLYGIVAGKQRAGLLPPEFGKRWWKQPSLRYAAISSPLESRVDAYRRLTHAMALPFSRAIFSTSSTASTA